MAKKARGIDQEQLPELRQRLIDEIIELDEKKIAVHERQEALRATLIGVNMLLGLHEERPKGADAVVVAMEAIQRGYEDGADAALTVAEIVEELRKHGWLPVSARPDSAVRASIRRLRDRDPRWGLYDGRLYYHDGPMPSEDDDDEEDD